MGRRGSEENLKKPSPTGEGWIRSARDSTVAFARCCFAELLGSAVFVQIYTVGVGASTTRENITVINVYFGQLCSSRYTQSASCFYLRTVEDACPYKVIYTSGRRGADPYRSNIEPQKTAEPYHPTFLILHFAFCILHLSFITTFFQIYPCFSARRRFLCVFLVIFHRFCVT